MQKLQYNEWTFSGEVIYVKELKNNEFAVSVKMRGASRRLNSSTSQITEFGCLIDKEVYKQALKKGFDKFCYATLGGHIESWIKTSARGDVIKNRFVVDDILDVEKK